MPDGTPESDALTRRKMISWARFAYRVATEDPGLPLDADYCETVSKLGEIGSDLAPDGLLYCRKGGKGPWRVASLFNVKCGGIKHIFKWRDCPDRRGPKSKGRAVRFAQGAILHMVQDSYSQSHVYRGTGTPPPANGTFAPRIVCAPARHFYEYNEQDSDGHSAADALPALDSTCKPGAKIDDVITATAKIIWHIEQKRPEDEFIHYLETSVLG